MFYILFKSSLALQIPGQAPCYGVSKLIELATCRGFGPPKFRRSRAARVHTIKKQHVALGPNVQCYFVPFPEYLAPKEPMTYRV